MQPSQQRTDWYDPEPVRLTNVGSGPLNAMFLETPSVPNANGSSSSTPVLSTRAKTGCITCRLRKKVCLIIDNLAHMPEV